MTKQCKGYTEDEIVGLLARTDLPTLVVEGESDKSVFDFLEDYCFEGRISIFPTGGCARLAAVFRRRNEFSTKPVGFLADQDMECFRSPPSELKGVVFTEGYSIENEILSGGKALRSIPRVHTQLWNRILESLSLWFASVAHRHVNGEPVEYRHHPSLVVCYMTGDLLPLGSSAAIDRAELRQEVVRVLDNPIKYLRGHTLIEALGHFLATKRISPQFSKAALLKVDLLAWDSNKSLQRLVAKVEALLFSPQ